MGIKTRFKLMSEIVWGGRTGELAGCVATLPDFVGVESGLGGLVVWAVTTSGMAATRKGHAMHRVMAENIERQSA